MTDGRIAGIALDLGASRPLAIVARHPHFAIIAALCVAQIVFWTLAPILVHDALPDDVLEGYMWGREWVLATYKHPALPSWVLEGSRLVTGVAGWPAYLVSQLFIAATFIFVFLLGRDMMGSERATAGTLLLTGVTYCAAFSVTFNHNVAQSVFWAALPWALWRAVERKHVLWWVLVGALGAAGLYAKFWMALLLLSLAGWILWDRRARQCLATSGPWVALAVCVAGVLPLAIWLAAHDFAPLHYAHERGNGGVTFFLVNAAINLAGVPIMLAVAAFLARGRQHGAEPVHQQAQHPSAKDRTLQYLVAIAVAPTAIAVLGALIAGQRLKYLWAIPMFNHVGLLAMALLPGWLDRDRLRWLARTAAAVLVVAPLGYMIVTPLKGGNARQQDWPQSKIAARMQEIWATETGDRPLRIVAGDIWTAGLVGVTAGTRPSWFTNGRLSESPWITPERIERQGMLMVWRQGGLPPDMQALIAGHSVRHEEFATRASKRGHLTIEYVVIPPKDTHASAVVYKANVIASATRDR